MKYIFILMCSILPYGIANAEMDMDYQTRHKVFSIEMIENACQGSVDPLCKEKYIQDFPKHAACAKHTQKMYAQMTNDSVQIMALKKYCEQNYPNDELAVLSCKNKGLLGLAQQDNLFAINLAINEATHHQDLKSANKWKNKHDALFRKWYPECDFDASYLIRKEVKA